MIIEVILFLFLINFAVSTNELNVLNQPLELCGNDPITGYTRNGYCIANDFDQGSHFVCATVTNDFLEYTKSMGNDLSTPHPPYFPGLKPGNNWCLCVYRWIQAKAAGKQPPVVQRSTNFRTLDFLRNYNLSIDDLHEDVNSIQNLNSGFAKPRKEL